MNDFDLFFYNLNCNYKVILGALFFSLKVKQSTKCIIKGC
jgi:hypothetical protein